MTAITHVVKSLKHEVQPPHYSLINQDNKQWSEWKLPSHHLTAAVNCILSICINTILTHFVICRSTLQESNSKNSIQIQKYKENFVAASLHPP